jgi:anti-sigma B factor antagonist
MALTIASREEDGVTVLDLRGRIILGEGCVQLRDLMRELFAKGAKKILLNMEEVNLIDSAGLGELASAFTSARSHSAELKLLRLSHRVDDLLQLTRLNTVFDIYDDEASAIASFK